MPRMDRNLTDEEYPIYAETRIISSLRGQPEVGQEITLKDESINRRLLVGWNHRRDTPEGRKTGKIWGWKTRGPVDGSSFLVYDEDYNRSEVPGVVRDCGMANFTMIRMFHQYWCPGGHIPRDMHKDDKKMCRQLYADWEAKFGRRHNRRDSDDDPNDPNDPNEPDEPNNPEHPPQDNAQQQGGLLVEDQPEPENPDAPEGRQAGDGNDIPMFFGEDDDNNYNDGMDGGRMRGNSLHEFLEEVQRNLRNNVAGRRDGNERNNAIIIPDDEGDEGQRRRSDDEETKPKIERTTILDTAMNDPYVKVEVDLTSQEPEYIDLTQLSRTDPEYIDLLSDNEKEDELVID